MNGGSISTVDERIQAQIRNIEREYGKPLGEWIALIKESGLTKHTEIVAMLKSQYGMSHGSAHRVALKAKEADAASLVEAGGASGHGPVTFLYPGHESALKGWPHAPMAARTTFRGDL